MEQEQKWIRAVLRRGSREAADRLVRAYYDEIYRFAYRQTGKREDAMDLTQECFLAALRSLHTYDPKKSGFRTWLYRVAAHKVTDLRRKSGPVFTPLDQETVPDREDFVERVQNRELLARVEQFVCGTDPKVQEVFRLRVYGGCSFPEIAAAAMETEAAVKARYYRLTAALRKEFADEWETGTSGKQH